MKSKSTKTARKKSAGKVRDLAARKDPKGGAQKKEGLGMSRNARGGPANQSCRKGVIPQTKQAWRVRSPGVTAIFLADVRC